MNGLSQLQLAVTVQEHAVENAESLLPPQEEVNLSSVIVMMFSAKNIVSFLTSYMFLETSFPICAFSQSQKVCSCLKQQKIRLKKDFEQLW